LNAGLDAKKFELVGFSLGGQLSGYIGRKVKSLSGNFVVPRIIALEPAILSPINLNKNDATFVVTIHTENQFSNPLIVGHVAFWPNGGVRQPVCVTVFWPFWRNHL
jgi:predicted alpha/beta-fold hydrolase